MDTYNHVNRPRPQRQTEHARPKVRLSFLAGYACGIGTAMLTAGVLIWGVM